MKITKRIHEGYTEMRKAGAKSIFGKYQYIMSSDKGKISLVEFTRYHSMLWEIYCFEGDLFEDVERFHTKEQAIEKAKKYLEVKQMTKQNKQPRENNKVFVKVQWKKTPNGVLKSWKITDETTSWLTSHKDLPFFKFKTNG